MERDRLAKAIAAVVALLVQVGGLVLLAMERDGTEQAEHGAIRIRVLPLTLSRPKPDAAPPPTARPRATRSGSAFPTIPVTPAAPVPEIPSRSITPAPTDWQAAMQAAARRQVEQEARRAGEGQPLDSKPPVLAIPKQQAAEQPRIVTLPNGDLQTHTKIRGGDIVCIHSQPALDEAFSPWARHRPARCTFKEEPGPSMLESMEETVKPRYLRRPDDIQEDDHAE
jgi:type IV secretory pathway VirB10-like protein